jgi:hypothetical protein
MRGLIFFLLSVLLLAACGSRDRVPADIIPTHTMETIVWQLMQSDEYVNTLLVKDSAKKSSTERMLRYQQVFELNKTSMAEFKKSYRYYMAHPDITKVMFDSIIARAGRQRIELYKSKNDSAAKHPVDTAANRLKDSAIKHLNILAVRHLKDTTVKHPADSIVKVKPVKPRRRKKH